jgi:hypothetical protein
MSMGRHTIGTYYRTVVTVSKEKLKDFLSRNHDKRIYVSGFILYVYFVRKIVFTIFLTISINANTSSNPEDI